MNYSITYFFNVTSENKRTVVPVLNYAHFYDEVWENGGVTQCILNLGKRLG
jgi:hypothetical protein